MAAPQRASIKIIVLVVPPVIRQLVSNAYRIDNGYRMMLPRKDFQANTKKAY